ncbi:MAG: hypothetical protein AAB263_14140, partial [Planctomycetota bacterium]
MRLNTVIIAHGGELAVIVPALHSLNHAGGVTGPRSTLTLVHELMREAAKPVVGPAARVSGSISGPGDKTVGVAPVHHVGTTVVGYPTHEASVIHGAHNAVELVVGGHAPADGVADVVGAGDAGDAAAGVVFGVFADE